MNKTEFIRSVGTESRTFFV